MRVFFCGLILFASMVAGAEDLEKVAVKVKLTSDLTCKKNPAIIFTEDLVDRNGALIVAKGTPMVYATHCEERGAIGKPGKLKAIFGAVETMSGQTLFFHGAFESVGKSARDLSIGLTVGSSFIIPPFSLFFLCWTGTDAKIEKDTEITVEVDMDMNDFFSDNPDSRDLEKAVANYQRRRIGIKTKP